MDFGVERGNMSEIKIYPVISKEEVKRATPLLDPSVTEVLSKGLPATTLVAVENELAIGALAGAMDGEVFEIVSLYVVPEKRRIGAATALVEKLIEVIDDEDVAIRAQYTMENEDNSTLMPFFKSMGFVNDRISYPTYYIGYLDDIKIDYRNARRIDGKIVSFAEVSSMLLKSTSNDSLSHGYPVPEGGLTDVKLERDLCFCVVKDGKIGAYVTVENLDDGLLEIPAIWSGLQNPMETVSMVFRLVGELKERFDPETRVAMLATNIRADKLIDYIFEYTEPVSYRMVRM